MKKIMLTVAGMLMFGFAVNAQTDSTNNYRTPESQTHTTSPYKISNRERVQSKDLPASMRQSLKDQQYKGWENAPIYRDKVTNDYYFDLPNDNNGATTYRFDKSGAAIKDGSSMNSESSSPATQPSPSRSGDKSPK